jgi:hypothetical protein
MVCLASSAAYELGRKVACAVAADAPALSLLTVRIASSAAVRELWLTLRCLPWCPSRPMSQAHAAALSKLHGMLQPAWHDTDLSVGNGLRVFRH